MIAHGAQKSDPLLEFLQKELTERKYRRSASCSPSRRRIRQRPDSDEVLLRVYRAAVAMLHNDPTAAPAHLFIGGKNAGAAAAVHTATARTRVDGLFLLGYPLHKQDDPESVQADQRLSRVVNPILFLTGTRDRHCDLATPGAAACAWAHRPRSIRSSRPTTRSGSARASGTRTTSSARVLSVLDQWMHKVIGEDGRSGRGAPRGPLLRQPAPPRGAGVQPRGGAAGRARPSPPGPLWPPGPGGCRPLVGPWPWMRCSAAPGGAGRRGGRSAGGWCRRREVDHVDVGLHAGREQAAVARP